MRIVVNTGPLVFLSKIDRLSILQKFGNVLTPTGVISEIKYKQDPQSENLGSDSQCPLQLLISHTTLNNQLESAKD